VIGLIGISSLLKNENEKEPKKKEREKSFIPYLVGRRR
jgi:hypothetical protein